ncbi:very short patch repair endonuclease, partial [Candidatus Woesearchaeota archaeon]|nr:very short patch repair endonuclease [Candidatus Woesearchaeota archaeon]
MRNVSRDPRITSQIMSKIRSKNTKPEIILAKSLRKNGIKFRRYSSILGTPDFIIYGKKLVIFCDGDFWHGNNWRLRKLRSRAAEFSPSKKDYWLKKIKVNIARDKKINK